MPIHYVYLYVFLFVVVAAVVPGIANTTMTPHLGIAIV